MPVTNVLIATLKATGLVLPSPEATTRPAARWVPLADAGRILAVKNWAVVLALSFASGCSDFKSLRACAALTDGGVVEPSACSSTTGGGAGGGAGGGGGGPEMDSGIDAGPEDAGFDAGADAGVDAGAGQLGPWDGGIEVLTLEPAWNTSLPIDGGFEPRFGDLVPITSTMWAHLARRNQVGSPSPRPRVTLVGLNPETGAYVTAPEDLNLDIVRANANGGALSVVTWNRVGNTTDGGDRGHLAYSSGPGGFLRTRSVLPEQGIVAATMLDGGPSWLEIANLSDGGAVARSDSGVWPMPCPVLDYHHAALRGAKDALMVIGACDGGHKMLVARENGAMATGASVELGTYTALANWSGANEAVLVNSHWEGSQGARLSVTRLREDGTATMERQFIIDGGQPVVFAAAVDRFNQTIVPMYFAAPTFSLTQSLDGGDPATAVSANTSGLWVLQLDAELNPARIFAIQYPARITTRSIAAAFGHWLIDVQCVTYDGGPDPSCPPDRTGMAMKLIFPDGGAP